MNEKEHLDENFSVVLLETEEGRRLLAGSEFNRIVPYAVKQKHRRYCGLCSIAMCLNELLNSQSKTTDLYQEMRLTKSSASKGQDFDNRPKIDENHVLALVENSGVLDKKSMDSQGITLQVFADVVKALNLQCVVGHALKKQIPKDTSSFKNVGTLDEFRDVLIELFSSCHHVVVNYDLCRLGYYNLKGHFSPLGGINLKEDKVLILDVWPTVPVSWVKMEDLFDAMATVDSVSGQTRGFCAFKL
jgi:hypothetical protein